VKLNRILLIFSLFVVIGVSYYLWYRFSSQPVAIEEVFQGKVWSKTIENLPDLKGVGAPRAENCGKCHGEIYKEWKTSTHAHALSDLQFQAELSKPGQPKWICLNCHIPVQNQRENSVTTLNHGDSNQPIEIANPMFDEKMQKEAVTCATCHVRVDDAGMSYVIGANGNTNPPHPIKINKQALRNRCFDCHNETYTLSNSLVCYFQTGKEMKEAEIHFPGKDCVSCHLPEVKRSFVNSELKRKERISHKHAFIGGGVPKEFSLYAAQIPGGYRPGVILKGWELAGETISVSFQNANAGHYVPSGDPERFLRLELLFLDAKGNVLVTKTSVIGQIWSWDPKAELVSENRLRPKEERIWKEKVSDPKSAVVVFRMIHVKLKESNSKYMASNAKFADLKYREKIAKIKDNYPHSSLVLESKFDLKSKVITNSKLEDLFLQNEGRRGE
jgi:hypothetical protein